MHTSGAVQCPSYIGMEGGLDQAEVSFCPALLAQLTYQRTSSQVKLLVQRPGLNWAWFSTRPLLPSMGVMACHSSEPASKGWEFKWWPNLWVRPTELKKSYFGTGLHRNALQKVYNTLFWILLSMWHYTRKYIYKEGGGREDKIKQKTKADRHGGGFKLPLKKWESCYKWILQHMFLISLNWLFANQASVLVSWLSFLTSKIHEVINANGHEHFLTQWLWGKWLFLKT